jgi:ureidoglycolate lyase
MLKLAVESLTAKAFSPFGDVVETSGVAPLHINQGYAERFDNLAPIDVADQGGATKVSIFEAKAIARPIVLRVMERHPLGSQIFYPLQNCPWIVVVCGDPRDFSSYRAFLAAGSQGVNYRRNAWHHPLIALQNSERFIVVDRLGQQSNLEEIDISGMAVLVDHE